MGAELLSLMNLKTYRLFSRHKGLKIENVIIISLRVDFRVSAFLLGTVGTLTVWEHRWTNDDVRTADFNLNSLKELDYKTDYKIYVNATKGKTLWMCNGQDKTEEEELGLNQVTEPTFPLPWWRAKI